jgi:hypothetical protein
MKTVISRLNQWTAYLWVPVALGLTACSADVNLKVLEDLMRNQNPTVQVPDNRSFHMNTTVKNSGDFQFFFVAGDPVTKKTSGDYTFEPTSIW